MVVAVVSVDNPFEALRLVKGSVVFEAATLFRMCTDDMLSAVEISCASKSLLPKMSKQVGNGNRVTALTNMNANSSRSHGGC